MTAHCLVHSDIGRLVLVHSDIGRLVVVHLDIGRLAVAAPYWSMWRHRGRPEEHHVDLRDCWESGKIG